MERNVNKGLTLLLLHLSAVALAKTPTGAVEGLFSISSTASSSNRATQKVTFANIQKNTGDFYKLNI